MLNYTWKKEAVPFDLEIRQVYGVAFTDDKRIVLRVDNGKYKLTGGKPEKNESYEVTLKREYIEELNIELEDIHYLGYLLVEENNETYAQVRMISRVKSVNVSRPDVDTGRKYQRFLSNIKNVKQYLNYKDKAGNLLIDEAIELANQKYHFAEVLEKEEFI